jgi:hypothetical protein
MIVGCFRGEAASPLIEIFTAKKGLIGKPQTVIHFCLILFRHAPAAGEETQWDRSTSPSRTYQQTKTYPSILGNGDATAPLVENAKGAELGLCWRQSRTHCGLTRPR